MEGIQQIGDTATQHVVVIDVETTGFLPGSDEVLKVSMIDGDGNTLFDEFVKPQKRKSWPRAQETNGITPEMVKDARPLLDYADAIEATVNGADLVVGYNLEDFDIPFLFSGGVEVRPKKTYDVMKRFAPIYGDWSDRHGDFTYKSLAVCARHYGYGRFKAHDSLEDCKATLFCYQRVLADDAAAFKAKMAELQAGIEEADRKIAAANDEFERSIAELREKERLASLSPKSRTVALVLVILLGLIGAHRFYAGKTGTAILMIVTVGGCGFWWLADIIIIAFGKFTDNRGLMIGRWR
jgi:DNA polymerase-3 subunit epsilon